MNIIKQQSLFDYSKIEILGDLERFKLLINNVPDKKIVDKLNEMRGKGRNDYPIVAVWNAILIMPLLEASTVEQLRRELSRNSDLRKICGFSDENYYLGKCKLVPPAKAFSNVFKNLKKIEPMLKECFNDLRNFMMDNLEGYGTNVGEDGKIFSSKAKNKNAGDKEYDARSETEADYTKKETYYTDKDGISQIKTKTYFGFRYHLLADVDHELPLEYTVTPASKSEKAELSKHLKMLPEKIVNKIETVSADRGYDAKSTIEEIKDYGIKPVIDIRNMWGKSEPTKQYKNTDIVYTYDGKIFIVDEKRELISLKYLGYDKIRETLRYSCGQKVYSIEISEDPRVFTPIARDSLKWKKIYNKRTALERINGRFDRDFNLENHKVRGLKKAKVLIDIMMIGMMSIAKGHILNNEVEKIRKIKAI